MTVPFHDPAALPSSGKGAQRSKSHSQWQTGVPGHWAEPSVDLGKGLDPGSGPSGVAPLHTGPRERTYTEFTLLPLETTLQVFVQH